MAGAVLEIAIALVWREGCLLITRRPEGKHLGGLWEFPGGKCLPDETPDACAVREVREEVGVACEAVTVRPAIEYAYPDRTVRLHPVDCRCVGGAPRALDVAEWAWVAPQDLSRYQFPPANAGLLRELEAAADRERHGEQAAPDR